MRRKLHLTGIVYVSLTGTASPQKTSIYRIIIFTNWSCCCCGARRVVANTLGKLLCTNNTNQSSPGPGGVVNAVRKTPPGETTAPALSRENGTGSPGTPAFAVCVCCFKNILPNYYIGIILSLSLWWWRFCFGGCFAVFACSWSPITPTLR